MIVHDEFGQGSVAWLYARAGIPTASEFGNLVTPKKLEIRSGETFNSYVSRKLAEKWGGPIMGFTSFATDQGGILETEGRAWFEFEHEPIRQVGFITTDDGKVGCSPDGLLKVGGIEFKCPQVENHVRYLLAGKLPDDYLLQVQGCMYVTGEEVWKFVSYRRKFPALVLNVQRDEKVQEAIRDALDLFQQKFDAGWDRLCDLNGGPPPPVVKPEPMVFADDIRAGRAADPDDQGIIP
jgi:hypothetical protein